MYTSNDLPCEGEIRALQTSDEKLERTSHCMYRWHDNKIQVSPSVVCGVKRWHPEGGVKPHGSKHPTFMVVVAA